MKKYWLALSFLPELAVMAGILLLYPALQGLWREPAAAWVYIVILAVTLLMGLLVIAGMCAPVGVLTRQWVEGDAVCMENVRTHRIRKIPLNAPFAYRCVTRRFTWLILSEEPIDSTKAAITLHRKERAMFIPVVGPLAGHLSEKASRSKKLPR